MRTRTVLTVVAAALALSACGTSDPGSESADGGKTRTIEHAMGSTEIPVKPKKVVVLDTDKIDTVMSLGVKPIAAARPDEAELPKYLGDLSDVKVVGTLTAPDTEAIDKLNPDLILGTKFRQEEFYDELSEIAPTVFTEAVGTTWKENFLLDGDAIGKRDKAKDLLDEYETRAKDFGEKLGDASKTTVSIIRFMPDHIRMYGPDSFSGIVVGDTGLARPELQQLKDAKDKRFAELSSEKLDEADADVLFYCAYGEAAAKAQAESTGGSLWKKMSVVKDGNDHEVDDEIWMTGIGVTAANLILDDLEKHVKS
ncbi:ABC transporter substrate-binding protein [Stackebrandtia nassauensis]|uniref:Periplasmic binding protein n=1 Tax=Stackebrandtia nassauensis (strain DSM 44728 / CIP 108903 / NRRL B-16338 / NBRC 102104 / LLR-40K-21) TaxID=446470 RepID=D3PWG6_STANL|nr:iron-siderophore ABC transporter substrate-binding protein [Stackebrandtia nassauensis]ADD43188.1 periplasmic binding protein [Stackebrandtia nassauensis DSM 44728]